MYTLLIVDDEKVVIDGLLSAIDWHEHHIEVVGTAMDGNTAYQLIEETKPNIVMADIRMPGLNGLDLIQKVKAVYPDTVFIIISGYTQFDYAKRAIELETVDYLTKPIEIEEIIETVKRAIDKYKKLRVNKETRDRLLYYQLEMEEKHVLYSMFGSQTDGLCFIEDYKSCGVLVTRFKGHHSPQDLLTEIKSSFPKSKKQCMFAYAVEELLVLVCFDYGETHEIGSLFGKYMDYLKRNLEQPIFGISGICEEMSSVQHLYQEAMEAYHIGLYLNQEVTFYEQLQKMNHIIDEDMIKSIERFFSVQNIDFSTTTKLIQEVLDYSIENKLTPAKSKFLCFKLMNHVFEYVQQEFDVNVEIVLTEEKYVIFKQLNQLITIDEHKGWLVEKTHKLLDYLLDNQMSQKEKLMHDVKKYLKKNYGQSVGLDDIAEEFHISPAYLSSLFSKEVGVTLFEYLINMRMEKAKELLRTTNNKISEICQQVGYENQRYFNQVFKKNIGTTPGVYRSNHLVRD